MRWREETEDVITVAFHEVQSDRKILIPVNDWSTGAGGQCRNVKIRSQCLKQDKRGIKEMCKIRDWNIGTKKLNIQKLQMITKFSHRT